MTPVIVDDALRAKLNGLNETVPFCEADGNAVGVFLPQEAYIKYLYLLAQNAVSEDELEVASRETGGRSLAEIRRDRMGGS